jgi:hypothetical protein
MYVYAYIIHCSALSSGCSLPRWPTPFRRWMPSVSLNISDALLNIMDRALPRCVCACVRVCVCVRACVHPAHCDASWTGLCPGVHVCVSVYVCMCVSVFMCVDIRRTAKHHGQGSAQVCMSVCAHVCMYKCSRAFACVCVFLGHPCIRSCSGRCSPPRTLAFAPLVLVQADARSPTLLAFAPDALVLAVPRPP